MKKNSISIVFATHNRAALLRETIVSARGQTLDDWELIAIDDASTDETAEIASEFDDARMRFFRLDKHGERSAARNLGLEKARGEFVMFLDDDDLLRSAAFQSLRQALLENAGAVAAIRRAEKIYGERVFGAIFSSAQICQTPYLA